MKTIRTITYRVYAFVLLTTAGALQGRKDVRSIQTLFLYRDDARPPFGTCQAWPFCSTSRDCFVALLLAMGIKVMDCWSFVDFQSNCTISKIESCVFDS